MWLKAKLSAHNKEEPEGDKEVRKGALRVNNAPMHAGRVVVVLAQTGEGAVSMSACSSARSASRPCGSS